MANWTWCWLGNQVESVTNTTWIGGSIGSCLWEWIERQLILNCAVLATSNLFLFLNKKDFLFSYKRKKEAPNQSQKAPTNDPQVFGETIEVYLQTGKKKTTYPLASNENVLSVIRKLAEQLKVASIQDELQLIEEAMGKGLWCHFQKKENKSLKNETNK